MNGAFDEPGRIPNRGPGFGPRWKVLVFRAFAATLVLGVLIASTVAINGGSRLLGIGAFMACMYASVNWLPRLDSAVRRFEQRGVQAARDALAAATPSSYFLYLRPFATTGRVPILRKRVNVDMRRMSPLRPRSTPDLQYMGGVWDDLETVLAEAVRPIAPLIGLGRPGEQVGMGRIETSEENWRKEFHRLAQGARAILLVPSLDQGTWYEFATIRRDRALRRKTVLVIPPRSSGRPDGDFDFDRLGSLRASEDFKYDLRTAAQKAIRMARIRSRDWAIFDDWRYSKTDPFFASITARTSEKISLGAIRDWFRHFVEREP